MIQISGLSEAIRHIEQKRNGLQEKNKLFLERLADIGVDTAGVSFREAQYDGDNDVTVMRKWTRNFTSLQVVASGHSVLFIEFGTGIHYVTPHPLADELGFVRGGYGHHLGKHDSWRYEGNPGTNGETITEGPHAGEIRTHGNPASRSMYDAGREMRAKIADIAKEVYSSD